ncbi:11164_t:CDS:10 [Funneliformis mosseae]|uniref:11164_t:CDS:1 n=1 Tax=Funneliformis mosseae TaxID=27381 RepID=A0A9N8ZLN7_FUNMO|nr:11164_t:CDS:10 [Funneliformis mosseae]
MLTLGTRRIFQKKKTIMDFIYLNEVSVIATIFGGFIVVFGLVSYYIKERLYLSESLLCLIVGIIIGPYVLNVIEPDKWGNVDIITREFTRVVISIQVMAAGVALPKAYLWKELKSLTVLLVPVMSWMWIVSALAIWLLIPNVSILEALMISSCVTPTDPVLANSVVKGRYAEKHVPNHVRNIVSAESGANDGLGYPFLFLAIYLMQMPPGEAIGKWVYFILGYQIVLSIIIGFIIGYVARKLLYFAEARKLIDKEIFMTYAIVLALFIMGAVSLIGSDDILACFIAGNSFTWDDWFRKETAESHFQDVIDLLLNLAIFVYLGTIIPWTSFDNEVLGLSYWRLIVISIIILLFRRLPIVMACYKIIPAIKTHREGIFAGWFGPIGVGAVFYAQVAKEQFAETDRVRELILPVVFFLVIASITIHGLSVPMIKLGKRVNTITISRTKSIRQGQLDVLTKTKIIQGTPSTSSSTKIDEHEKPIAENDIVPDFTIDINTTGLNERILASLPLDIDQDSHEFSIYEEDDNYIVEDETDGKVYVINNSEAKPAKLQEASTSDNEPRKIFSLFKKSPEQNDR